MNLVAVPIMYMCDAKACLNMAAIDIETQG